MAALFFDIDGTVVSFHTNTWLPGVKEKLTSLRSAGHQIIFISMRGPQDDGTEWSTDNTAKLLAELPFEARFVSGVQSQRILIDDVEPRAISTMLDTADWLDQLS